MTSPAEQLSPPKHDRSLTGFYIAVGVVAALVGLGAWLYKPLRLAYAIRKVEAGGHFDSSFRSEEQVQAFVVCAESASRGNATALEVIVRALDRKPLLVDAAESMAVFRVAAARPDRLLAVLDRQPDAQAICVLRAIEWGCCLEEHRRVSDVAGAPEPVTQQAMVGELVRMLEIDIRQSGPEVCRVAQTTLDFTRRRFAKELAGADKTKGKTQKP